MYISLEPKIKNAQNFTGTIPVSLVAHEDPMENAVELKKLENEQLELKNARLKIIADTVKVIFSAGIISIATVYINNEYQQRELELQREDKKKELELARIEKENEFIRQFVTDISDESIEVKKEITTYFSHLLPDGTTQASERWKRYGEYIDQLIAERNKINKEREERAGEYMEIEASLAQAKRELDELKDKGQTEKETLQEAVKAKNNLEVKLAKAQDDIDQYRNRIEAINYVQARQAATPETDMLESMDRTQTTPTSTSNRDSLWSYIGTYRNEVYVGDTNFNITQLPEENTTITATVDVSRRSREPRYSLVRGWTLGDRKDVIKAGGRIKIQEVELIPAKGGGYRVWVRGVPE